MASPASSRVLVALLAASFIMACGADGTRTAEPSGPGEVTMTIARAANSAVPASAESAWVRVWNPGTGYNQVRSIAIPAPGTQTQVAMTVPSGTGYSVGVIAWRNDSQYGIEALAGGRTDGVSVGTDANTQVAMSVVPWEFTYTLPDTVVSGAQVPFLARTSAPLKDFFMGSWVLVADSAWTDYGHRPGEDTGILMSGDSLTGPFNAPTVAVDSAMYVGIDLYGDYPAWQTGHRAFWVFAPAFALGQAPVRVPMKVPTGGIVITFDKNKH